MTGRVGVLTRLSIHPRQSALPPARRTAAVDAEVIRTLKHDELVAFYRRHVMDANTRAALLVGRTSGKHEVGAHPRAEIQGDPAAALS